MRFSKICSLSSQKYLLDSFMRIRLRDVKRLLYSPQYIEQNMIMIRIRARMTNDEIKLTRDLNSLNYADKP